MAWCAGLDHGLNNVKGKFFVLHQRRASPFIADFFGRAAHVDVNDLCAPVHVVGRSVIHHLRVRARNLHCNRLGLAVVVGASGGFQAVPQIAARGDHFTDRITGTQPFAEHAKRPVRDTRHWRSKHVVGQNVGSDIHGAGDGGRAEKEGTL